MGGRGGSSGLGSSKNDGTSYTGLDVTRDGETTRYYFTKYDGTNYYQRGISGMPEPTPLNMSMSEFRRRVESNGATTKSVSSGEQASDLKRYKADRDATNDFLNKQEFNKMASRGSKWQRIMDRAQKRRR